MSHAERVPTEKLASALAKVTKLEKKLQSVRLHATMPCHRCDSH